jgi:tRNA pseudouridine38-40 synthase
MARYKLTLSYDGTDFSGSQRQSHPRTVQGEIEKACRGLGWRGSRVLFAGRTDSGVHASGQVAAIDLEWGHSPEALLEALNAQLPWDVAIQAVELVEPSFHPRFDARSRRYCYHVRCSRVRDPLHDRTSWRVWPGVEPAALNRVAALFLGRHDFGAFGAAAHKGGSTERMATVSEWSCAGAELRYEIAADGFLYRMVRRLVFVQVAAAQGRCEEAALLEALGTGRATIALPAGIAPAQGLVLVAVDY